jgi:magnesium transporter
MNVSEKNGNCPAEGNTCSTIEIIDYDSKKYNEYTMEITQGHGFASLGNIAEGVVRWINIDGQCTEEVLKEIGGIFNIHPLVTMNIQNISQRTKIEEYQDFLYIVAKMIYYSRR